MTHKPNINDIYLAKQVEKKVYFSKWEIKNIKCPLCETETEIVFDNTSDGNDYENYDIYSKLIAECKNCEWIYNCVTFSWAEQDNTHDDLYYTFDTLSWKIFCKIWEKIHYLYNTEIQLSKNEIQYCKDKKKWFSKNAKEKSICPFCRGDNVFNTEEEDIIDLWCFDCLYFGKYKTNEDYTFGINNNLNFNCEVMKHKIGENYSVYIDDLCNGYNYYNNNNNIMKKTIEYKDTFDVNINKKEYELTYKIIHNLENHNLIHNVENM